MSDTPSSERNLKRRFGNFRWRRLVAEFDFGRCKPWTGRWAFPQSWEMPVDNDNNNVSENTIDMKLSWPPMLARGIKLPQLRTARAIEMLDMACINRLTSHYLPSLYDIVSSAVASARKSQYLWLSSRITACANVLLWLQVLKQPATSMFPRSTLTVSLQLGPKTQTGLAEWEVIYIPKCPSLLLVC